MQVGPEMIRRVREELDAIARTEEVVVLLAVESGSRAWGFASQDSDYDVRFLYLRTPCWYLSIDSASRPDVLEYPFANGLDISGWDLRKALLLLRKNNPPILEWLKSPVTYVENTTVPDRLRRLAESRFQATASFFHYLHMAQGNLREYLQGETVWRKKYFYVLRPLLAIRWLERHRSPVPVEFQTLLDACLDPGELADAIRVLMAQKIAGVEMDRGPRIPVISEFVARELKRHEDSPLAAAGHRLPPLDDYDRVFRDALQDCWGLAIRG